MKILILFILFSFNCFAQKNVNDSLLTNKGHIAQKRVIELRFYNTKFIPVSAEIFWFETGFPKELNENPIREEAQRVVIPMTEQYLKIAYRLNEKNIGWITIDCHESMIYNIVIDSVFNVKCTKNCISYTEKSTTYPIKKITDKQKFVY